MMISTPLFGFLILIYIILAIFNLLIAYKLFKDEKEISTPLDFFINLSSLNFKTLKILLGKKSISNKTNLRLLRINFFCAMFILLLLIWGILNPK